MFNRAINQADESGHRHVPVKIELSLKKSTGLDYAIEILETIASDGGRVVTTANNSLKFFASINEAAFIESAETAIESVNTSGNGLASEIPKKPDVLSAVMHGVQITGVVLAGIFLLAQPLLWLLKKIKGESFVLSNSAKLIYGVAVASFAAGIVAITLPVAAPFIGLTLAGISILTSIYTFGRYFFDRYKLQRKIDASQEYIYELEKQLDKVGLEDLHLREELDLAHINQKLLQLEKNISTSEKVMIILRNATRILIASAVLVGVVLSFTPLAPIGITIAFVSAFVGLALFGGDLVGKFWSRKKRDARIVDMNHVENSQTHQLVRNKLHASQSVKIDGLGFSSREVPGLVEGATGSDARIINSPGLPAADDDENIISEQSSLLSGARKLGF